MPKPRTRVTLLALTAIALAACGENQEYTDRVEEIETNAPPVAPTPLDSAVEGATVHGTTPLDGATTVRTDSAAAQR